MGGSVAIAILWRNLFAADGIINTALTYIGLDSVGWLTNPNGIHNDDQHAVGMAVWILNDLFSGGFKAGA